MHTTLSGSERYWLRVSQGVSSLSLSRVLLGVCVIPVRVPNEEVVQGRMLLACSGRVGPVVEVGRELVLSAPEWIWHLAHPVLLRSCVQEPRAHKLKTLLAPRVTMNLQSVVDLLGTEYVPLAGRS